MGDSKSAVGVGMNMSVVMGTAVSAMSAGLGRGLGSVTGMGMMGTSRGRGGGGGGEIVESLQLSPIGKSVNLDDSGLPESVGDLEESREGEESQMFPGSDLF